MNDEQHLLTDEDRDDDPYGRTMSRQVSMHTLIGFNELRLNAKLCDASLILDNGHTFPIHRSVLSGSSDFFRLIFDSAPHEEEHSTVPMKAIDSATMELILQYIYMRQIDINNDNVLEVMRVADYLCIDGLVQLCHEFVVECLGPENCVTLLQYADYYYFGALRDESYKYIVRNFTTIAEKSGQLMKLGREELRQIVGDEQLNVRYEEDVWEMIMEWVDTDPENRKNDLAFLLPEIRFGLMDYDYFTYNVRGHRYIENRAYFRPYLIETFKFRHMLTDNLSSTMTRPRYPSEVLFAIGGWSDGNPTGAVETYDTKSDSWTRIYVEDSYGPRAYHGTVVVNHYIYVIGGFDGLEYFSSCRKFDTVTKTWEEVAPMNCKRCYVSVALMDGVIYAMGGSDGHQRLCSVEKYDLERNQWTMIASMTTQRSDACAAVLNGKLYITGGFNGLQCMNTAETYDADANAWTLIAPMQYRRSGLSSVAYHGHLYALGGFNGQLRLNSGEKFDPAANRWLPVAEMSVPRSNFAVDVLDDMVIVAGGFNGVTTIGRVDYYNDHTDKWFEAKSMHVSRSALSTCVIKDLPDIAYYMPSDSERLCEEVRSQIDKTYGCRNADNGDRDTGGGGGGGGYGGGGGGGGGGGNDYAEELEDVDQNGFVAYNYDDDDDDDDDGIVVVDNYRGQL